MNYTFTISYTEDREAVESSYAPAVRSDLKFQEGDVIAFTSTDGDWVVGYNFSPFRKDGDQGDRFEGKVNTTQEYTVVNPGRYRLDCGIWNGSRWVGYGDGGGDIWWPFISKTPSNQP